jgi:hypothetical protein
MVRPPKIRHSKARHEPVTIDLDPADVKRETAATPGPAPDSPTRPGGDAGPRKADERPDPTRPTAPATDLPKQAPDEKPAGADMISTTGATAPAGKDAPKPSPAGGVAASGPAAGPGISAPGAKSDEARPGIAAAAPKPSALEAEATNRASEPRPAGKDASAATGPKQPVAAETPKPSLAGAPSQPVAKSQPGAQSQPGVGAASGPAAEPGISARVTKSADARPGVVASAPKPSAREAEATTKASEARPAGKDASAATGPKQPIAAEAPKSSSPAGAPPVFGRGAAASEPSAPPRAAPPPRPSGDSDGASPRRGGLSMLAAGVVGGIVVLAGAGALQYAGILPAPGTTVERAEPARLADLRAELAALRDEVEAGGGTTPPDAADTARLDDFAATVDQLRADITELRSAISQGEGGDAAGLQALDRRMSEIEATVAALGPNAGPGESVDLAPLTERLGVLETRLETVSGTAQSASEAAAALPGRMASFDERLATIDVRVGELAAQLEEQASNPRIALAIAAAGLKAAIDRGEPFMTELETYASIAPDAPEIADLRGLAASGVPTRGMIGQEVNAAANRMIAAAAPPREDAGFFGRLLDSMQSVVKVRPIGDVAGDDAGAIVARLEAAIRAGDYDRAVAEYANLPEPARQAGAGFIADVKARLTADELVERALSVALRPQEG